MESTMMGGTVHCWLSMIHSSVTPNCWVATQLDMERLVVETAWESLFCFLSYSLTGLGIGRALMFMCCFSSERWFTYWIFRPNFALKQEIIKLQVLFRKSDGFLT